MVRMKSAANKKSVINNNEKGEINMENEVFVKAFMMSWRAAKSSQAAVVAAAKAVGILVPDYEMAEKDARLNVISQLEGKGKPEVTPEPTPVEEKASEYRTEEVWNEPLEPEFVDTIIACADASKEEPVPEPKPVEEPVEAPAPKAESAAPKKLSLLEKLKAKAEPAPEKVKEAIPVTPAATTPAATPKKAAKAVKQVKAATTEVKQPNAPVKNGVFTAEIPGYGGTALQPQVGEYHQEIAGAIAVAKENGAELCVKVPVIMTEKGIVRGRAVISAAIQQGVKKLVITAAELSPDFYKKAGVPVPPTFAEADENVRKDFMALVAKLVGSDKVECSYVESASAKQSAPKAAKAVKKANAQSASKAKAVKKVSVLSRLSQGSETDTIPLADVSASEIDMDILAS